MNNLKTYVLPRPFYGYNIPIAIQSSYIKDYAAKKNYAFSLPETEITTSNVYLVLKKILSNRLNTDLAFTSIFMLPVYNKKMSDNPW